MSRKRKIINGNDIEKGNGKNDLENNSSHTTKKKISITAKSENQKILLKSITSHGYMTSPYEVNENKSFNTMSSFEHNLSNKYLYLPNI